MVFLKRLIYLILFLIAVLVGVLIGLFIVYQRGLPRISILEEYQPSIMSVVYDKDGRIMGEFAIEKRIPISYNDIPPHLRYAIITAEDRSFEKHWGIDMLGILRALKTNILSGWGKEGASTITQQLARMVFLKSTKGVYEKTLRRKIKEWLLSFQIEKNLTKEQIFTLYANLHYFGHGAYGVEAASILYFGKSAKELTLSEAALIAGLPRSPQKYSPYLNPRNAVIRRNYILDMMTEEGYIKKEEAEKAKKEPVLIQPLHGATEEVIGYVMEEIRKYVEQKFGTTNLYQNGLKIYTTIDINLQRIAQNALRDGLREIDKRRGWRGAKDNLSKKNDKIDLDTFNLESWAKGYLREGKIYDAIVLEVSNDKALIRIKDFKGELNYNSVKWTGMKKLTNLFRKGDVIEVKINKIDSEKKIFESILEQEPEIEGAVLGLEAKNGAIRVMLGGYSFPKSEFNRAIQAKRQTGSAIKPIIYTAAIDSGFTPSSQFIDEPYSYYDKWINQIWSPQNFDHKYRGLVTLRRGLEESINVVTAKILELITPEKAVNYAKRFGITADLKPYMSFSLGAFEIPLIEIVSAYSVFPNQGIRMKPYFIERIEDREGNLLEESRREAYEVISPSVAYIMTNLMKGVVLRGTAVKAKSLGRTIAGKTGTSDEYTDAWFIGFDPNFVLGVWVGYDIKKTIGPNETGARAALPIWIEIMKEYFKDKPVEDFPVPPDIVFVKIDRMTGLLATPFCSHVIEEAFIAGTEPTRYCSEEEHLKVHDYYGK
ncbi:MAG: penicillin-binding protein 1A [Candidatus Aminicenantia bacterium]